MVDVEKITNVAMNIITYAGMAKSNYLRALKSYKNGDCEEADRLMEDGDVSFGKAHECHGGLLMREAETEVPQITLILAHAEDQLMNAETIKIMTEELMELYGKKKEEW